MIFYVQCKPFLSPAHERGLNLTSTSDPSYTANHTQLHNRNVNFLKWKFLNRCVCNGRSDRCGKPVDRAGKYFVALYNNGALGSMTIDSLCSCVFMHRRKHCSSKYQAAGRDGLLPLLVTKACMQAHAVRYALRQKSNCLQLSLPYKYRRQTPAKHFDPPNLSQRG